MKSLEKLKKAENMSLEEKQAEKEKGRRRRKDGFRIKRRKKEESNYLPYRAGVYFDEKKGHIISYSKSKKEYKKESNKKIRKYDKGGELTLKGAEYKKIYDLWWNYD